VQHFYYHHPLNLSESLPLQRHREREREREREKESFRDFPTSKLQKPKTTRTLFIQSVVTKPHNAAENPKTNNARTKASFSHGKKKSCGSDGFSIFLSFSLPSVQRKRIRHARKEENITN
jgi:hypothetical protein